MAIRGNLSEASLADVLQLLAIGQKSGCLSIAGDTSLASVHFERGRIVHAEIVNRRERLGDRLLRHGLLSARELSSVLVAGAPANDRDVAEALLGAGIIDHDTLLPQYRAAVEEAVYHLFAWTRGTFTFEADARSGTRDALVSISTDSLLLEGARRVDEWTLIEKKIPSLDLIFELDSPKLAGREIPLSDEQASLLPYIDGTADVDALIERTGMSEFDVGKALYGLVTAGYAHRVGRSAARRQPPAENRIAEHRNLGVAFYRTGLLEEARRELRQVLDLRPNDTSARFHLGLIDLQRRDWTTAAETFREVCAASDAPASAWHNLAFALERLGELDEADSLLEQITRRGGATETDPRVHLSRASIALRHGDPARADTHLEQARVAWGMRQPSAAWFHAAGLSASLAGEHARAIDILEQGIAVHPHAVALQNNLAVVQDRRGMYELASRTLEHALLEDSTFGTLHKNLGDYHYRAARFDEALDAYACVVRLNQACGPDVHLKIGNIHFRRGAHDRARTAWEEALRFDANHRIVRANLDSLRRTHPAVFESDVPLTERDVIVLVTTTNTGTPPAVPRSIAPDDGAAIPLGATWAA